MAVRSEEQARYWARPGKRRSPDHVAVAAFARPKVDLIVRALELRGDERPTMLEVGAGSGYLSVPLAERFELTCLDFSPQMLELNPIPAGQKIVGDAQALPMPDKSFDVALCANLLHHLPDPVVALQELRRVARDAVVLIEPNATNPLMFAFAALKKEERGAMRFTARHVQDLAERAGLRLRSFVTHGAIVPNATPPQLVPALRLLDRAGPLGFYHIGVFEP